MLPNNLYSHNQAYTGKQLRHFPLNTVLAPPPATALSQDQLGSEAEEEEGQVGPVVIVVVAAHRGPNVVAAVVDVMCC